VDEWRQEHESVLLYTNWRRFQCDRLRRYEDAAAEVFNGDE
jgi:hypothetical protein